MLSHQRPQSSGLCPSCGVGPAGALASRDMGHRGSISVTSPESASLQTPRLLGLVAPQRVTRCRLSPGLPPCTELPHHCPHWESREPPAGTPPAAGPRLCPPRVWDPLPRVLGGHPGRRLHRSPLPVPQHQPPRSPGNCRGATPHTQARTEEPPRRWMPLHPKAPKRLAHPWGTPKPADHHQVHRARPKLDLGGRLSEWAAGGGRVGPGTPTAPVPTVLPGAIQPGGPRPPNSSLVPAGVGSSPRTRLQGGQGSKARATRQGSSMAAQSGPGHGV